MQIPYSEEVLATSNSKLAATLLAFGAALRPHNPTFVAHEYKYDDLKWKKWKDPNPPERVFFNFIRNASASAIAQAFESGTAENQFESFLTEKLSSILAPEQMTQLRALHSAALAQGCREVLEKREYLVSVIKATPNEARWMVIRKSKDQFVIAPLNATEELLAKLIPKRWAQKE
jgi:ABC-type transport system substrate-binding protein